MIYKKKSDKEKHRNKNMWKLLKPDERFHELVLRSFPKPLISPLIGRPISSINSSNASYCLVVSET